MSNLMQSANHIASSLYILALLIVLAGVIAFFAARRYGRSSRRMQRAIFSVVGFVGILGAAVYTFLRLRGQV